ncbi:WYL domain-containing protein [Hymenobacter sp. ISL-91]|uniref:helix-turn-helix transcriptional regulator n=1 Tax=Hymenobacter sp. ISL-91 TaxID=2819151 RepID=UPI001BE92E97|nr:WYL domain-containing protein [Hymenobacter sp. ISL-91]MBT2557504.1 WYL domain-containing protein [Hymenobacter sp. ISL-91]
MPARAIILRQMLLVQRLQRGSGQRVPFEELQRHLLAHGSLADLQSSYPRRTFERDLREIEDHFGLRIKCQRGQGYYIAETDPQEPGHGRLLEALELQEFLRLPAALAPFVQAETRRPQGLEHLRPLLAAMQAGRVVEFDYRKFWEQTDAPAQRRTVGPLLLKEYRGRWYVLAAMVGSGHLACFGLDRISQLVQLDHPSTPPPNFNPATYYTHAFGIIRPDTGEEPAGVVLRFSVMQGRYALSYPLHPSQRVLIQTEEEIRIELRIFDTHDFRMELLSYGPEVEVLAPAELRDWLRQAHAEALW